MADLEVDAKRLAEHVAALLVAHGVASHDAEGTADALVNADLEGVGSHGVMLLPMYLDRIRRGSVNAKGETRVVEDHGGYLVLSAGHALGQVSSAVAVEHVVERARRHGAAVAAVRHGFHFGAASYWARRIAEAGMVGLAMSNTRPLMPAPGGAERVVGNNPLAIAFPSADGAAVVIDMAMSASAMGRIRLADSAGRPIPEGWATDAQGQPTTSAAEAIHGMLLPAAGPKGFGLAVAIDLLSGALSGGSVAAQVKPLYDRLDEHYDCAHAFIALDASKAGNGQGIGAAVTGLAQAIRDSRRAPGVDKLYAPGDLERERRDASQGSCRIPTELVAALDESARSAGISSRLGIPGSN